MLGIALGRASSAVPAWAQDGEEPPSEANPTHETLAVPEGQPRYLEAMRRELDALSLDDAACAADDADHAHCVFHREGETSERNFQVSLAYSDVTDTIYIYIPGYLTATSDGEHTDLLMRRLMELNSTMLLGRFEWNSAEGEVRIGAVLHTDSNFDRRAFRSAVGDFVVLADRHYAELDRIARTGR